MKDFIVWDVQEIELIKNEGLCIDENGKIRSSSGVLLDENSYKPFFAIGLTDINDKSIYADCSIVEFNYCFGWQLKPTKHIGYFSKDNESLQLEIIFIDDEKYNKQEYTYIYMSNFTIIDTIQENKLGLIK